MTRKRQSDRWRSFEEAKAFVHGLALKNQAAWYTYCLSSKRPSDIPSNPQSVYASKWRGLGDWLGTGAVASHNRRWRPFTEARRFVHTLGLKNQAAWSAYYRSGKKPADIPTAPDQVYRDAGWQGIGHWLGTGTVASQNRQWRAFTEARQFVRSLGLKNEAGWRAYCRSGQRPEDIPSTPAEAYSAAGWRGMGDWLGTGTIAPKGRQWRSFPAARQFVHTLGLKNWKEWRDYNRAGKKPDDIPVRPEVSYGAEWRGVGDWLGTGTVKERDLRPFPEARAFVHTLGLRNQDA